MTASKSFFITIIIFCLATVLFAAEKPVIPDSIAGTWSGKGFLNSPLAQKIPPSDVPADNPEIQIIIGTDGSVTGTVGQAHFCECIARKNRGWLGRLLNIKTDYIIKGGYLQGSLCPQDTVNIKKFTLPFNIRNGLLTGTIMQIHKWKYPDPLVRIKIEKDIM